MTIESHLTRIRGFQETANSKATNNNLIVLHKWNLYSVKLAREIFLWYCIIFGLVVLSLLIFKQFIDFNPIRFFFSMVNIYISVDIIIYMILVVYLSIAVLLLLVYFFAKVYAVRHKIDYEFDDHFKEHEICYGLVNSIIHVISLVPVQLGIRTKAIPLDGIKEFDNDDVPQPIPLNKIFHDEPGEKIRHLKYPWNANVINVLFKYTHSHFITNTTEIEMIQLEDVFLEDWTAEKKGILAKIRGK